MGRDILKELIETDTTHSTGSTTVAAERMAARLVAAGFPKADVGRRAAATRKARRRRAISLPAIAAPGARKPLLFIAHLDVVEARREDWSMDPFVLNEKDGYFYGRGTLDVKGGAATLVAAFVAPAPGAVGARPRPDPGADGRRGGWTPTTALRGCSRTGAISSPPSTPSTSTAAAVSCGTAR